MINEFLNAFGKDGLYIMILRAMKKFGIHYENTRIVKKIQINKIGKSVFFRPFSSDVDVICEFFLGRRGDLYQYDIDFVSIIMRPPRFILDGGSNIGLFSVYYDFKFNHPEKIVAIEPDKSNYSVLKKNIESMTNVYAINGGVWSNTCYLKTHYSDMGKWGTTVSECEESESEIMGYSISEIMRRFEIPFFDIVKLDIEGSEFFVFKDDSCKEWLKKTSVLIIETHDNKIKGCFDIVNERMKEMGYSCFAHGENLVFYKDEDPG